MKSLQANANRQEVPKEVKILKELLDIQMICRS